MSLRRAHGFTLIEVLLATALLAAGLTLAFATLRSAQTVTQRGDAVAARSERMRTVEGFLRQRLAAALPVAMGKDAQTQRPLRFVGQPQRMRFVADVPDYLGYGGPYLHDIAVDGTAPARRLGLRLSQVQAGVEIVPSQKVTPEVLAADLVEVHFAYRGFDPQQGRLGEWQDAWTQTERLPQWVRIEVRDARGAWPPLLVALPQAPRERLSL